MKVLKGMYYNCTMIDFTVPGCGQYQLKHLVCDVNGTLALDGILMEGVAPRIAALQDRLQVHLVTADTHGGQETIDRQLHLHAVRLLPGNEARQKAEFVRGLGAEQVVAIGQGANDAEMLKESAVGICVLSREGSSTAAIAAARLVVPDIFAALELLEKPLRLIATLRT